MLRTASAPAGDTSAASAPAAGGNPDTITIPRSQYDTIMREHGSLKAAEPYRSAAQKFGIRDPKEFEQWAPLQTVITDRRMTHAEAAALLRGQQAAEGKAPAAEGQPKQLTHEEMTSAMGAMKAELLARGQHNSLSSAGAALRTKILTEALGEKPTEAEKKIFERAVRGWEADNPKFYPEGHPLKDLEFAPYGEEDYKSLADELKGFRARAEAEEAVNLGNAVNAGKGKSPSSAAGASPQSGKPTKDGDARPGGKPSAATVQAAYDARVKARGRAPL